MAPTFMNCMVRRYFLQRRVRGRVLAELLALVLVFTTIPAALAQDGQPRSQSAPVVALLKDGTVTATAVVIGFEQASGNAGFRWIAMAPATTVAGVDDGQLAVKLDGVAQLRTVEIVRPGFASIAQDQQKLEMLAQASGVSPALALERFRPFAGNDPVVLLVIEEPIDRAPQTVKAFDQACPVRPTPSFDVANQSSGAQRFGSSDLAALSDDRARGALSSVECLGETAYGSVVTFKNGSRLELVPLADLFKAVSLYLKGSRPEAEVTVELQSPRYVGRCQETPPDRQSARIGESEFDQDRGKIVLKVVDLSPRFGDPDATIAVREPAEVYRDEFSWSWGNRGRSGEMIMLRTAADGSGGYVLDRYCKDNLAPRGRIVGKARFGQGSALSLDSGAESSGGQFAVRLNDKITLITTPGMRHGVVADSFPEEANAVQTGRMYFGENADGELRLIGHSRSKKALYLASVPDEDAGGTAQTTGELPALAAGQPQKLGWADNVFKLEQLGWQRDRQRSGRQQSGSQQRSSGDYHVEVQGRFIAIAGDAGLALLKLETGSTVKVLANILRSEPNTDPRAVDTPLRRRFASGSYRLMAATVARAPRSSNLAIIAHFSEDQGWAAWRRSIGYAAGDRRTGQCDAPDRAERSGP